jgi:hypothetical protein
LAKNAIFFSGGVPDPTGLGTPPETYTSGELPSGLSGVHLFSPGSRLAIVSGFPHSYHPLFHLEVKTVGDG